MPDPESMAHFPPGAPAPQASKRDLRSPEHLAKLREGKEAWYARPAEERRRITAERKATREAKRAEREARRAAKNGGGTVVPPTTPDVIPPTERSSRTVAPPPAERGPDSDVPRPGALRGPLQGLIDLVSAMPSTFGDGVSFIQVTRVKPTVVYGMPCGGVQRPIWEPIDDSEFLIRYGGGEYQLRGYQAKDGGRVRALTEPVAYRSAGAPNLDSILTEEDAIMRPNHPPPNGHTHPAFRRPGVVTPQTASAEAQMHDRQLTHEERERAERRAERQRERLEAEQRDRERVDRELSVAELLDKSKEREMARLDEAHKRQLELAQSKGGNMSELAQLLQAINPRGDTDGLVRQHAAEIKQLSEGHKSEMLRLTEGHKEELRRLSEGHTEALRRVEDQARLDREKNDNLLRDAERRALEQVREVERRAAEQIKETERRADQRVSDTQAQARQAYEDLKTRGEERLNDQRIQYDQRLADLRDRHAGELRTKDSEITLMRQGLEGNQQVILQQKDAEIKRLQHDLRDARDLAEKNKDWVGRMQEFQEQAEAMGFEKGGEGDAADEDLKTTAAKAALGALGRLPELITAGAEAAQKLRNPGVPPDAARNQARSGMVRSSMRTPPRALGAAQAPLPFATEDGTYTPPPGQEPPRPYVPPHSFEPEPLPPVERLPPLEPPPPAPLAPQQEMPQHQALPPAPPPSVAPAPAPQPASSVPPEAPPSAPAALAAAEEVPVGAVQIIESFTPVLVQEFNQKSSPETVAQGIVQGNAPELIRMALGTVTIEQLVQHLKQTPGPHGVLVTRNGEKFLREVWRLTALAVAE